MDNVASMAKSERSMHVLARVPGDTCVCRACSSMTGYYGVICIMPYSGRADNGFQSCTAGRRISPCNQLSLHQMGPRIQVSGDIVGCCFELFLPYASDILRRFNVCDVDTITPN